jgi:hypothetical protein
MTTFVYDTFYQINDTDGITFNFGPETLVDLPVGTEWWINNLGDIREGILQESTQIINTTNDYYVFNTVGFTQAKGQSFDYRFNAPYSITGVDSTNIEMVSLKTDTPGFPGIGESVTFLNDVGDSFTGDFANPSTNISHIINIIPPLTGTPAYIILQAPSVNVIITNTTSTSVDFTWGPYTTDTYSIILDDVIIEYGLKGDSSSIYHLTPFTDYSLQVKDVDTGVTSDPVSFQTLKATLPDVTVTEVTTNSVYFTWTPYTTDTYSVILNENTIQSGLQGNTSSILYLTPSTEYLLIVQDITVDTQSEAVSFTTLDLSPPHRLITSTTNGQFIIPSSLLPPLSIYTRMIAVDNMRIVYKTSANAIESFVVRSLELDKDVVTFPYQSAITNYGAIIASNSIGLSIVEPYTDSDITLKLYYISSIDGQRHEVTGTYQCTGSFVMYNYEA